MSKTLIILNPHASSGLAGRMWGQVEPLLWDSLGELVVAITQREQDVAEHLENAYASGLTRVISIGGDGTNHALINALAELNERHPDGPPMVYGNLPIGTGRDWARGTGIPVNDVKAAARWIAEATPQPTDIGLLKFDHQREHFLNIASVGAGGEVAARVNSVRKRRPWTFLLSTVQTLLQHKPREMQVTLDGTPWYDGRSYVIAIANGTTFGHGMKIAPKAETTDGLFDVVLVEGVSRIKVLAALNQVFSGSHLSHPNVRYAQARRVEISGGAQPFPMELDGELAQGAVLTFEVKPGLLQLLG
jgi:YegS/Rv2252/BmrU family lipid kinase